MVANRVDPETRKAAKLGNSKLRLSCWAEGYASGNRAGSGITVQDLVKRAAREMKERGPSTTRVPPRLPRPRGPERGGGGFER